ncbi:unnamed protein product [Gongylonema pulchrum]|uniref:MMS1_N domain-containing protein n=1 Tax=Gongylonema pulchrum TaxID=637853 RepID=A0A183E2X1_9BILA|nr:unnamed protein product [Gongylonema pulchrum]
MALNYVVTAHKSTVITHALAGDFIRPKEISFVLATANRIQLFLVAPDGLVPFRECPIYGRIACLKIFRRYDENVDSLLVLTSKYHLAVIQWMPTGAVVTRAYGQIADRVGRPSDTGMLAAVHSSGLMVFRLYDGVLKMVKWAEGSELRGVNITCDDLFIVDLVFLPVPGKYS